MEEVLEVYARAPDPARPLVCLDECTKPFRQAQDIRQAQSLRGPEPAEGQLTREVRAPQAAAARPFSSLRLSRAPPPRRAARARGLRV